MLHALLCSVLVVVSAGCATNFAMQREREPLSRREQSASVAGMEPLIKTTRGTGLVLGIRMPLDLGARTSADKASVKSKSVLAPAELLALVAGKSRAQLYRLPAGAGRAPAKAAQRNRL